MPFREKLTGHLLLYETNEHLLRLISVVLKRLGLSVESTRCGSSLREMLENGPYNLVLLGANEYQEPLLSWLRKERPELRRLVFSLERPPWLREDEVFLAKPFTLSELKDSLRPMLLEASGDGG